MRAIQRTRAVVLIAVWALGCSAVGAVRVADAAPPPPSVPAVGGGGGYAHAGVVPGGASQQPPSQSPRAVGSGSASYPINGIDIASYQHPNGAAINWTSVARSGVEFAYIKATEGTTYVNPYYQSDARAAKAAGLYVGAYAFVRPDSNDPVAQADAFVATAPVPSDGRTLPPMIDIEWPYSGSGAAYPCWGRSPAQMSNWLRTFANRVQARTGRVPSVYTNNYWWDPCTASNPTFASSALSIAHYNGSPTPLPAGWRNWAIWQYTSSASVPGIVGAVDADVFNGTVADLLRLTGRPDISSAPSAVVRNGYTMVFAVSTNGKLYVTNNRAGTFSAWSLIAPSGTVSSSPSAVVLPSGEIDVFAAAPNRAVYVMTYLPSVGWSGWRRLPGGPVDGAPTAVVWAGNVIVFATAGQKLFQASYTRGLWHPWFMVTQAGAIAPSPSAVVWAGELDVIANSTNNQTAYRTQHLPGRGWTGWQLIGGGLAGPPNAVQYAGHLNVYATVVNKLYQTHNASGRWAAWYRVTNAGAIVSPPSAVTAAAGVQAVYATAGDRSVWQIRYRPGFGWTGWSKIA